MLSDQGPTALGNASVSFWGVHGHLFAIWMLLEVHHMKSLGDATWLGVSLELVLLPPFLTCARCKFKSIFLMFDVLTLFPSLAAGLPACFLFIYGKIDSIYRTNHRPAIQIQERDVPDTVKWVRTGSSEGWTPFINGQEVPESSKRDWAAAFEFLALKSSWRPTFEGLMGV
ncbi:hypothetical protein CK203_007392 [Vitis vinifera]|uniref:Uncharacterized protein n=1 Tax=Vitis vinifera TaxID=29760 RepID=A0A438G1T6_VITVI|nr:hypothetical protein CK203_007392 [Vitis vinifera]